MAAQAEADVVATELERVLPKVSTLFDREGPFYTAIEKKDVEIISARQMRGPLEIRPGGKFRFYNPDGGDMGRGSGPKFDKFVLTAQHILYAVEYTILTQWVTDDKRKAVINNVQRLLALSMREFRRHCDAMAVGSGDGVIGTVATVNSQTDYVLDNSFGAKLIRFDQDLNVYSTDLLTRRTTAAEVTVNLHDLANKRITVSAAPTGTVVVGDKIVVSGLSATPPVGIKGVMYHHSNATTGNWLGFDRSLTPEIRANRVNGNNSALTLPLPRLALNLAADRVGTDNTGNYQAWMHPAQAQAYEELGFLITQINNPGTMNGDRNLDLYFGGAMVMAGAPVKKSFNWHRQRIDFVNMDYWGRGELHPAGFYEPVPGKRLYELRGTSGGLAASVIFYLAASFDLFVGNPAGCSYIDALGIPSGY